MNTNQRSQFLLLFPILLTLISLSISACQSEQQNKVQQPSQALNKATENPINEQAATAKFVIHKPFEGISNKAQELQLKQTEKAQTLRLKNGAYLKVPAYAYKNAQGDTVRETVHLKYTTLHDVASIIASGVPMKYKHDNGTVQWMQTGGMFQLEGYTEEGPVELFEGKEMEVSFLSTTPGTFDFWNFDESIGNWKNLKKDQEPSPEIIQDETLEQEIRQLQKATKEKPVDPEKQQAYKMIFNDLDLKKCPNLKKKGLISLSYAGTDKTKDPQQEAWKKKVWYKKELKPTNAEKGLYQLTLYGDELYSIPVKLVLEGPALKEAIERYRSLLIKHQEKLNLLEKKKTIRRQQQAFRRTVGISGFGVFNYDILAKEYGNIGFAADFDFGKTYEEMKEEIDVFLITGANGMVINLPAYSWNSFRFNPTWDNKLLAVLPGDKVATFSQSDFDKVAPELVAAKGQNYEFKMNVKEQQILTVDDLKEVIAEIEPVAPERSKQPAAVKVKLYPNPAVDLLNIDISNLQGQTGRIYLSNNSGQVVKEIPVGEFSNEPIQLQVGQYTGGPYYLMVMADNKTVATEKLIIQR